MKILLNFGLFSILCISIFNYISAINTDIITQTWKKLKYDSKSNSNSNSYSSENKITTSNIGSKSIYFQINTIEYEIPKKGNLIFINNFSIPSDLIYLMQPNQSFEMVINQGRLPDFYKQNAYYSYFSDFSDFSRENKNPGSQFLDDNFLIDYPSGYLYHSDNFYPFPFKSDSNKSDFSKFKSFFDLFSNIFKFSLTPLLDRSSHIIDKNNIYFSDNNEKACTDHLDAIKETLPSTLWPEFEEKINYDIFTQSDYKSIKYFVKNSNSGIKFIFKIIYKVESKFINDGLDKNILSEFPINKNSYNNYFDSKRYFLGQTFNFENFVYNHEIKFSLENLKSLRVFDIIPDQLNILLSSIKVRLKIGNLNFHFSEKNLNEIFYLSFTEGIEEQNPVVPFTYENKKSIKLIFNLREDFSSKYLRQMKNLKNDKNDNQKIDFEILHIKISYELRKRLLNFESYENESEYGYKYPCGLIVINEKPILSNHIYFNMPFVDGTMPFNIIALSWVVFGFILIQIMNIFQGKLHEEKTILQAIKDRFMAKWGFLFGR